MKKIKLDQDTNDFMDGGSIVANLVNSDGWKEVKNRLYKKLASLDSITKLVASTNTPTTLKYELEARISVIEIINEWIAEIEGEAVEHDDLMGILEREKESEYIKEI
jgi:aspartate/glutamate racemase